MHRFFVILLLVALFASSCSSSLSADELDACFEAVSYDTALEHYGNLNWTMTRQITDAIPADLQGAAYEEAWKAAVNDLYGITYTNLNEIFGRANVLVVDELGVSPEAGDPDFHDYWAISDKTVLKQWNETDPSSLAKFCERAGQT